MQNSDNDDLHHQTLRHMVRSRHWHLVKGAAFVDVVVPLRTRRMGSSEDRTWVSINGLRQTGSGLQFPPRHAIGRRLFTCLWWARAYCAL